MKKEGTVIEGLCAILVKHQVIQAKEEAAIIKAFKGSTAENCEEFLIDEGIVDDINVIRALGEYYQVPAIDVVGRFFDHMLLRMFPKDLLLRNGMIPLETDAEIMVMVVSDPSDPDLLPRIGDYVSYDIRFNVGLRRHICDAVKEYYDEALTQESQEEDVDVALHKQALKREESRIETLDKDGDLYEKETK